MGHKSLEGKHSVYRTTIKVNEIYEVFLEKDFIVNCE